MKILNSHSKNNLILEPKISELDGAKNQLYNIEI